MSANPPQRSVRGARLKSGHHSMTANPQTREPRTAKITASGQTMGTRNLTGRIKPAKRIPGQRRSVGCGVALVVRVTIVVRYCSNRITLIATTRGGAAGAPLLDAMAYAPDDHKGHTMYVRGLLIKPPDEQRLAISAFEMVSPTCRE